MFDFWRALADPAAAFLRTALLMGVLASFAFGAVGSFVVARRITYVAGAIAHAVLGGVGAALYLQRVVGWEWCEPILGATVSALAAALLISWVRLSGWDREDSVIGATWATGMAAGLIFLSLTPGYVDPLSYLFGNILILEPRDLWLVAALDAVLLAVCGIAYTRLRAVCFDEEFAGLRGISVGFYYTLLLCLIALAVVLLMAVVGVVLVVALLTLPAALAGQHTRTLGGMMAGASLIALGCIIGGLWLSYSHDLPSGASIVLCAAVLYLASALGRRLIGRI
jgi:zinc transport system permease protein